MNKQEEMVKNFQCSGCTNGCSPKGCDKFKLNESYGFWCDGHSAGTIMMPLGRIALGLPKGFCRYGGSVPPSHLDESKDPMNVHTMTIRMHEKGDQPLWNHLNVAVWAMEQNGFLFVRTYSPRTNQTFIDVIEGGTLKLCPNAIDVSKFIDDID